MATSGEQPTFRIDTARGHYPIVYVRGFAATSGEREETFYDTYYGFAATAVEKRNAPPPQFMEPIVFEGQLIRLLKEYGYVDAANGGLTLALANASGATQNPARSLWISRFYDRDVVSEKVRPIEEHAEELRQLICETIPARLKSVEGASVDLGKKDEDYRVILLAHSMGGLVCRCLIQNLLPARKQDPARWIHRFVTMGSPHGGIELSAVPDFLEELAVAKGNVLKGAIFKEDRMREYLKLNRKDAQGKLPLLNSLGGRFPEGRCLSIVGSDHASYSVVRRATGAHSDGLVKQGNAYIKGSYWANVHRAHSGRRGIVNSFETYENVRRFLFGDTRVKIWLEDLDLQIAPPPPKTKEFYDVEFSLSIRGTGVFLHQRKQNPCENAQRFPRADFPLKSVHLHTGFLDATLRPRGDAYSHFLLAFRVAQHRIKDGFLFDHQYPERTIYSESLEVRVNLGVSNGTNIPTIGYRWLSDTTDSEDAASWTQASPGSGVLRFPLHSAGTLTGTLCVEPRAWPDETVSKVGIDAARG